MGTEFIEEAFQRRPRPQLPTKAALLERSLKPTKDSVDEKTPKEAPSELLVRDEDPSRAMPVLGELVQGDQKWTINMHLVNTHLERLVMVKRVDKETGRRIIEKWKLLDHPNIANVQEAFHHGSYMYLEYDFTRFTLEEILNVHLNLDEPRIQIIATSVFSAIKHLSAAGIVHTSVSISTIRVSGRSGKVQLANFENATWRTPQLTSNADLQQLGYAVLECMNGHPNKQLREPSFVQQQRESNKIFGLEHGEKWSGYKLLVDFLDELFNESKPAISKFDRPHRYVSNPPNHAILVPFLELVPLDCFAFWRPAAAISLASAQ